MTPKVRCRVPTGRTARSGIPFGFWAVACVTSVRKVVRFAWSWGRETDVTRGTQRKCVRRGDGDMFDRWGQQGAVAPVW